jgi:L-malate glycosyltransferase
MLDSLICVSNAVRDVCIQAGVSPHKTHVIHGGVSEPHLQHSMERLDACEKLGIQQQTTLYAAVGSLIPCKGYDRLIEAAHHMRWDQDDFCIVICGEGKSRPQLETLIRKYSLQKHVRLLGFQDQPERWICAADAFVHPAISEGLSLVTIQSQMIGTPAIACEVGGLREVLRNPTNNEPLGWIMQGEDPTTLANLMIQTVQNTPERSRIVKSAKEWAMKRFHLNRMIDSFEEFYLTLVDPLRNSTPDSVDANGNRQKAG